MEILTIFERRLLQSNLNVHFSTSAFPLPYFQKTVITDLTEKKMAELNHDSQSSWKSYRSFLQLETYWLGILEDAVPTHSKPQSEGGHYQRSESCSYRAILTQSLNTTRVIILDTAARVTLFLPLFLDQFLNLLVLPDTGGELSSQMDQVNLK